MRHEVRTEIDIEAPPEQVWSHLVDLPAWAGWNPFMTSTDGAPQVGQKLKLRMKGRVGAA